MRYLRPWTTALYRSKNFQRERFPGINGGDSRAQMIYAHRRAVGGFSARYDDGVRCTLLKQKAQCYERTLDWFTLHDSASAAQIIRIIERSAVRKYFRAFSVRIFINTQGEICFCISIYIDTLAVSTARTELTPNSE